MRAKDSTDRGKQNSDAAAAAAAAEPSSTIPQQTKLSPSAILAQCLKLLKGQSDEHKFAGLVMVTKHVPALTVSDSVGSGEKAAGRGQLRQICDAVGPPFVHRLLRTAGDSSSSGSDGGLSMYQQIALGVLAAFLQDANLVRQSAFRSALARNEGAIASAAHHNATAAVVAVVLAGNVVQKLILIDVIWTSSKACSSRKSQRRQIQRCPREAHGPPSLISRATVSS